MADFPTEAGDAIWVARGVEGSIRLGERKEERFGGAGTKSYPTLTLAFSVCGFTYELDGDAENWTTDDLIRLAGSIVSQCDERTSG